MPNDSQVLSLLRREGLRATPARIAVLELLLKYHGPYTVKEIHQALEGTCDLVTIYRTTDVLSNKGLLSSCDFGDNQDRFEFADFQGHHHHHLICRKCNRWIEVDVCLPKNWKKEFEGSGFTEVTHKLEFFGVCNRCQN